MPRGLLFSLLLLLSACSPPPPEPLRVAINPWPGFEYLYLAEQLKLFEAEGVQVKVLQFGSAHDSSRAYEQGQVDGYCTTPGGALLSNAPPPAAHCSAASKAQGNHKLCTSPTTPAVAI